MGEKKQTYSPLALLHSRLTVEGVLNDADDELLFKLIKNTCYGWETRETAIRSLKNREMLVKVTKGEIGKYAGTYQECTVPSQAISFGATVSDDDYVTVSYDLRKAARERLRELEDANA
jgi:hypothetical protein